MLLLVTGSSAAGKTTATAIAAAGLTGVSARDSDEYGVPDDADTIWRQQNLQQWVRHAIALDEDGVDLMLTAQAPLGELLATPEATELDLSVCLLDVADDVREKRLEQRDPGVWSVRAKADFVGWARWHREHAKDPGYHPEVVTEAGAPGWRWDRWQDWDRHDPRWEVTVVDSTGRSVDDTAAAVREWVEESRTRRDRGRLALARGWS